jgi:elongation factor Ts
MAKVTLDAIKELRKKTGVGVSDCKEALEESIGDFEKAIDCLRKKGVLKAKKRANRETSNGFIGSYVHNGQIGVLVELASETDFASRNEKFQELVKELALHIAASCPLYVSREDIPKKELEREKKVIEGKLKKDGKPKNILEKIVEGQLTKYYEEVCLLDQPYVRDDKKKIKDLIDEAVASFGERIEVKKFVRIILGEE